MESGSIGVGGVDVAGLHGLHFEGGGAVEDLLHSMDEVHKLHRVSATDIENLCRNRFRGNEWDDSVYTFDYVVDLCEVAR